MEWEKNKGGRPEKEPDDKRVKVIRVRLKEAEYQKLLGRMEKTNTASLSTFVRAACLEKPLVLVLPTSSDNDKILSLLREVRADLLKIGANINQAVKRINSTTDYHDLQKESENILTRVQEIESQFNALMQGFVTNPK